MGNSAQNNFTQIQKKYGHPGIDYIASKRFERTAYEQTRDETQRILDHANLQQREDLEWINQEKRQLDQALEEAKNEAQIQKKGLIQQNEARHKKSVRQFSGYNEEVKRLQELERKVREQYKIEREKAKGRIDQEIRKTSISSTLKQLPQFDSKSDGQRKSIEDQCLKKFPSKAAKFSSVQLERNLNWNNFKSEFLAVLNKDQVGKENIEGRNRIKNNVVPSKAPVCC